MAKALSTTLSRRLRERESKPTAIVSAPAHGAEALAYGGMCVAIGVVLPFVFHSLAISPRVVLPMHFAVFLAGMLLSPLHAAIVGAMSPALSLGLTGMPTTDQVMRMMPELATYGFLTALALRLLPSLPRLSAKAGQIGAMAVAMLVAMLLGRGVYVVISMAMLGVQSLNFYLLILVIPGLPGMAAQLLILPPIAYRIRHYGKRR